MTDISATAFFRQAAEASNSEAEPTYFHGTRHPFQPGDLIHPGRKSNQGYGQPNKHVFFTHRSEIANVFAESADDPEGHEGARPRVYQVEPTGPHEMDTDELPEDAKASGSRQSRHPLRVVQEHESTWEPDPHEFEEEGCEECGKAMTKEPHCGHCGYGHHTACCEDNDHPHTASITSADGATAFFRTASAPQEWYPSPAEGQAGGEGNGWHQDPDSPHIVRGLVAQPEEDTHRDVAHRLLNGTADHHDVLGLIDTHHAGKYWYTHGTGENDSLPDSKTYSHEGEHLKRWHGRTDPEDTHVSGAVGVAMVGHRPKGWNPDDNGDDGLMGNSYLPDNSHIHLHEVHYTPDGGETWHQAPVPPGTVVHTDGPPKTAMAAVGQETVTPVPKTAAQGKDFDWSTAQHYLAETSFTKKHDHRSYANVGEAQGHADRIAEAEGISAPSVDMRRGGGPGSRYWHSGQYGDGGPEIALSPDHMHEAALIHEMTHHFRRETGQSEGHDAAFSKNYGGMLWDHHSRGGDARAEFQHYHQAADAHMRANPDHYQPPSGDEESSDGSGSNRTAGRGKPRSQPGAGQGAAGEGADAAGAARGLAGGEEESRAVEPRPTSFHPAAQKELGKLDAQSRKRVGAAIDTLAQGGEGLQTHALTGPLKGWHSTKATRGHRVLHRSMDDGTLHIGYVGLHDYDKAINRLVGFFQQAADRELPEGTLQRGLNLTLDPAKHRFVHDMSQPLPSRAHLLLSELQKKSPDIDNETLKGGAGGLGELWTRNEGISEDAARYQHEQRASGERSTTVTLHAHEPGGEHFWNEMAGGSDYKGNWRVPLRPGTPVGVHGLTWGEPGGQTHHYDFTHPVDKHAALSATAHFRQPSPEKHTAALTFQQALFAEAAAVDNSSGIMIALSPPPEIAAQLVQKDGQSADDLHVTLAYLGKTSDYTKEQLAWLPELISSWAVRQKPVSATTGGVLKFSDIAEDQHVLCAAIDIPGGAQLHSSLAQYLEGHGYRLPSKHGWIPHMTLRYVDRHFRFMPHVPELQWQATSVETHIGGTCHQARLGTIPSGRIAP